MTGSRLAVAALAVVASAACGRGAPAPAPLDTRNETCRSCRMAVSDSRFAAQIVAPGEEPLFFDDIGCLEQYVATSPSLPAGAVAYVADHRTRSWVLASAALFTRVDGLDTPMNSHLLAHADGRSRDADPAAKGGQPVSVELWPHAAGRSRGVGVPPPAGRPREERGR
jgi:copper chaperone NosL